MSTGVQKTRQFISPNPLPPPMHSAWTHPTWTMCYTVTPQSRRHAMTATRLQFSDEKRRPSPRCSSLSARSGESQRTRRIVSGCNQDWGHEGRNVAESDLSCRRVCSRSLDGVGGQTVAQSASAAWWRALAVSRVQGDDLIKRKLIEERKPLTIWGISAEPTKKSATLATPI